MLPGCDSQCRILIEGRHIALGVEGRDYSARLEMWGVFRVILYLVRVVRWYCELWGFMMQFFCRSWNASDFEVFIAYKWTNRCGWIGRLLGKQSQVQYENEGSEVSWILLCLYRLAPDHKRTSARLLLIYSCFYAPRGSMTYYFTFFLTSYKLFCSYFNPLSGIISCKSPTTS